MTKIQVQYPPDDVMQELVMAHYDTRQLIQELWTRGVDADYIKGSLYALDQIADARDGIDWDANHDIK